VNEFKNQLSLSNDKAESLTSHMNHLEELVNNRNNQTTGIINNIEHNLTTSIGEVESKLNTLDHKVVAQHMELNDTTTEIRERIEKIHTEMKSSYINTESTIQDMSTKTKELEDNIIDIYHKLVKLFGQMDIQGEAGKLMDNIVAIQHILQQTKQNLKNTCDNCTTDMEVFAKTLTDEFCQVLEEKLQLVKEFNIKIANDINETIKNAQTNNDLVDVSSSVDSHSLKKLEIWVQSSLLLLVKHVNKFV